MAPDPADAEKADARLAHAAAGRGDVGPGITNGVEGQHDGGDSLFRR
jgi:hypothetical protein